MKPMKSMARARAMGMAVLVAALLGIQCNGDDLVVSAPLEGQLSLAGDVAVQIQIPAGSDLATLQVSLDGADVTALLAPALGGVEGTLPGVAAGAHEIVAQVQGPAGPLADTRHFETAQLESPDDCEVLNAAHCLYPYPSDRFRQFGPDGPELVFPQAALPTQTVQGVIKEIPASHWGARDGFSPTVQVLMNFPAGVDLVASNAPRLHEETRTTDFRSLAADSPTVLLEKGTNRRILHWLETDVRAEGMPDRQTLFLRPGYSLEPGRSYIVAVRNSLLDAQGDPLQAEPVFAAVRDGRPTTIPAVEARRAHLGKLIEKLDRVGIESEDLILVFDFTVASDHNLTVQMLSMRDQSFEWLANNDQPPASLFTVTSQTEFDCTLPDQRIWRDIRGTFQVPLFLTRDPGDTPAESNPVSFLQLAADGFTPVWNVTTSPQYGITLPCASQDPAAEVHPILVGHGLFGNGPAFAFQAATIFSEAQRRFGVDALPAITGGTHWRGLSSLDSPGFIGTLVASNLPNFPALPDRMRQGQLHAVMLARYMKTGIFNAHAAFQRGDGSGVFPDPDTEMYYYGVSLGGIMGGMTAAVTPDITRFNLDVPAINFSLLLQRATPFLLFQDLLNNTVSTDPLIQALGLTLLHELWVPGEPAGYATHITRRALPGSIPKRILITMAYLDQQVSNQATEITARTLRLPNLVPGSFQTALPQFANQAGPLDSALVVWNTGSLDPNDPDNADFIPPLANLQALPNGCDPHARRLTTPASLKQQALFFRPGGAVWNTCDGACDADATVVESGPVGDFLLELPSAPGSCPP